MTPDIIDDIAADFRLGVVHQPKVEGATGKTKKATRGERQRLCSFCMTICKNAIEPWRTARAAELEPVNMSRIFEALQRSESERSGVATAPPALATELLQAVERKASTTAQKDLPAHELTPHDFAEQEFTENDFVANDLSQFQSLSVSPPADSKLVCLNAPESFGAEKFRFLGVRLRQLQHSSTPEKAADYQHDSRGREEHGVGKPGNDFGSEAAAEDFVAGRRSSASVIGQTVWLGQPSRP